MGNAIATCPLPAGESRRLLAHVTGRSIISLVAHPEARLSAPQSRAFAELVERRQRGEPIAYLVGEREFFGRSFAVGPGVLVPRHETELVVEVALALLETAAMTRPAILDLGTGSGILAVTLASERPDATVVGVDISEAALEYARRNALAHGVAIQWLRSDWFAALKDRRFDLIVANPPYIAAGDPHLDEGDLRYEPRGALTDEGSGLSAIDAIVADAPAHLKPSGWLVVEHGFDQADAVAALARSAGFGQLRQDRDLAGILRTTAATLPAGSSRGGPPGPRGTDPG